MLHQVGGGNQFYIKFFAEAAHACSSVQHIATISNVTLDDANFTSDHIPGMYPCFESRHKAIGIVIVIAVLFNFFFYFKKALNTAIISNAFCKIPSDNDLIPGVLIDLAVVIYNWICDMSKKIFQ